MATMGKKGSDYSRDVAIMGNVGMYYDTCFFCRGEGGGAQENSFILKKCLLFLIISKVYLQ